MIFYRGPNLYFQGHSFTSNEKIRIKKLIKTTPYKNQNYSQDEAAYGWAPWKN